jgi:hypothetical protein
MCRQGKRMKKIKNLKLLNIIIIAFQAKTPNECDKWLRYNIAFGSTMVDILKDNENRNSIYTPNYL